MKRQTMKWLQHARHLRGSTISGAYAQDILNELQQLKAIEKTAREWWRTRRDVGGTAFVDAEHDLIALLRERRSLPAPKRTRTAWSRRDVTKKTKRSAP